MYQKYVKRLLDIAISLAVLVIFSPVLLVLAALVRLKLGSPVLFCQERAGRGEKIFRLYKFRTMTDARDAQGKLLPDQDRLTGFGRALRSSSLDELPEFFNILKGDMSFIGPRPLLARYLPYYKPEERARHSIRPGLTGLAQINGRNALNWEARFAYDLQYVEKCSFGLDLSIMLQTVGKVFQRADVLSGAQQTVPDLDEYRKDMVSG